MRALENICLPTGGTLITIKNAVMGCRVLKRV